MQQCVPWKHLVLNFLIIVKYPESINMAQPNESDCNRCEGIITKRKCWETLSSMNNNKSPGNDGLSKEFYICFFGKSHSALNQSFGDGEMLISQKQAVITSIEKKDKTTSTFKTGVPYL